MKQLMIFATLLLALAGRSQAQTSGIDAVLQQIEQNNKELLANSQLIASQKLANKAENNLPNPTLSYAHLWDSDDSNITVGELVIAQSFEFPTIYATRNKMNRMRNTALDAQAAALRQQILLQAKELCLDIIMLQRQQTLLDARLKNAEELASSYAKRLETGDASVLETNKINLELLNVRTEARMNQTTLTNKLKELTVLNGNQYLGQGRPSPQGDLPTAANLGLTDYPAVPFPTEFAQLCDELLAADATLQSFRNESDAARKQISASKQGWLPNLELGYRRNTEDGHPLNGVVVGFSFPLFENRHKVKIAKAQAANIDYQKENATLQTASALWQRYEEARNLHNSILEYQQTLGQQQDLTLLKKALDGGQISLIEYFVEVSVVYQSQTNLLQLENQYHKAMAQIYKSRL
ncbi:MAG: TolC family protein [Bacteroides sp.]|nr:TolC family protein [Bacteroides sp.]